jgi:hypothetical protein
MNQHLGAAILLDEFTAFIFAVLAKYEFCGAVEVEIIHVPSFFNWAGDARLLHKEDNSTMATSCLVSYSGHDKLLSKIKFFVKLHKNPARKQDFAIIFVHG